MPPSPPPVLDPPFRGYIETTFDSLLVFEAARRGMIPRVTRRLIDRERGMVQSGAVFVFDEHESGIKRWTDGLVWSPSRILGNFLVYRETDKRAANAPAPMSTAHPINPSTSSSPASGSSPSTTPGYVPYDAGAGPVLGTGQLNRPRSTSEGGPVFDRQKERQLVGSLTSSYKFKEGGLVKKTMSVTVNGFSQHMISYYSVEDVLAGKLRSPSTIPELASLEISPEYLAKQNFRFPPQIDIGHDGIPRYRGEPEEPGSPSSQSHHSLPMMQPYGHPQDMSMYEPYGPPMHPHSSPGARSRSVTGPILIPVSTSHGSSYMPPGTPQSASYMETQPGPPPIMRQNSSSSIQSAASSSGVIRPTSGHRRFDPYGEGHPSGSPRSATSMQNQYRRQSIQPVMQPGSHSSSDMYAPSPYQAPGGLPALAGSYQSYQYQPPATAPSAYGDYYAPLPRSAQSQSQGLPSPLSPNAAMPSAFPAQQHPYWPRGSATSDHGIISRQQEFGGPPSSSGSSGGSGAVSMTSAGQRPMSASHPHPAAVVSPIPNGDASQMPPTWPPQPWNGSVDPTGMPVRSQAEDFGSPQQQPWPRPSQETRIS